MMIKSSPKGKYPRTPEMRRNMSIAAKHRQYTPEGLAKLSENHKGKPGNALGKTWVLSFETRSKLKGRKGGHTTPHSDETKRKISQKKMGHPAWNKGRKAASEELERLKTIGLKGLTTQQNSKQPTDIEQKVYAFLERYGVEFCKQYLVNNRFLVDAFIPSLNLIIECDGDYWHSLERVIKKDKAENAYLIKCNFNLLRLTEKQIKDFSFETILQQYLTKG